MSYRHFSDRVERDHRIRDAYAKGMSMGEIAKQESMSKSRVGEVVNLSSGRRANARRLRNYHATASSVSDKT
jgi:hypothetical protein